MEQQRSLADYAQSLGISDANLRATVTAQLDQVEPDALDRLADLYHQPREILSDHMPRPQAQESFASWLKRNMEGITQHGLRARAQLDTKTLKQFLNGNMLPDSDQSERLARALYIDRTEVARVVTATMIDQAAGTQSAAGRSAPAADVRAAPAASEGQGAARPPRTRRRKDVPNGELASAEIAATDPSAKPEEQGVARPPRTQRRKDRSDGELASAKVIAAEPTAKTADIAGETPAVPSGDAALRPSARRQASSKAVAASSHPTETAQIDMPPAAGVKSARRPAAARQAGTATVTASERIISAPEGAPEPIERSSEAAAETGGVPVAKAPAQRSSRQPRRSEAAAKLGGADAGAPSGAGETEALASQEASEPGLATVTEPVLIAAPSVAEPPTGPVGEPAKPALADQSAPADSSQDTAPAPAAKHAPPARRAKSAPPIASTATMQAPAAAALADIRAPGATALELTPDELRLIRHWRQLHPHGRRATLHYIGSLLVED